MSKRQTDHAERQAALFKALANPNRLRIMARLAKCCGGGGHCTSRGRVFECVGELGRDLAIGLPTVSHHIQKLHRAGLIEVRRRGKHVDCSIRRDTLRDMAALLQAMLPKDTGARRRASRKGVKK